VEEQSEEVNRLLIQFLRQAPKTGLINRHRILFCPIEAANMSRDA
jgi:hypothetical protein